MNDSPMLHPVLVDLTVSPTLNFAMEQSGVPVVSGVRVQNMGSETLVGATLAFSLLPALGEPTVVKIDPIRGGEEVYLSAVDLHLPPGRLRAVVEAERVRLEWRLCLGSEVLASGDAPVEVLAFHEWPGFRAPPALLAAFVMPNHPVVAQLLRRVRDRLAKETGDNSLSGYQTRSPKRVVQVVAALVGALQDVGISYVGVPASFETVGQKVRLPDMLMDDGMGNCLDITVLLAGCLEQAGLAPLLVIVKGHAFPAVWLVDERFPEGVVYDAARIRTLTKLGQLLPFDSSTVVRSERHSLDIAVGVANESLANDKDYVGAVDVRVVRMDRFRPLPVRMTVHLDDAEPSVATSAAQSILAAAMREPEAAPAVGPAAPPEPVVARFKRWKDKLLDLSLHNRLLNFRPQAKGALPLLVPDLARFEDLLAADQRFEVLPRPDADSRDTRAEELTQVRSNEADILARRRSDLDRGLLYAACASNELLSRAVELDRAARLDREEGGANTLFAAVGVLRWYESGAAEQPRYAPLLLVPVRLEYDRLTRRVRLRRIDEEALGNVTLIEKVKRDFAVDLSSIAAPAADDSGLNIALLLRQARTAVQQVPRWEVLDEVHLGRFTFTKFLMWRDLDANADLLLQNNVVRHVAQGGAQALEDQVGEPNPRTLDDTLPVERVPLVTDCDSTQLSAVSAALAGRSFVLQGPPGTGKSQTITNLIASAIAEGKTVLFVSEKMAALEVVYRRLVEAGLGDYCLELHSSKASKKDVVRSLGQASERAERVADPAWDQKSGELDGQRRALNGYVRALHAEHPLGTSFYHASAQLLGLRDAPDVRVSMPDIAALTAEQWRAMAASVDALAVAAAGVVPIAEHPLRECRAADWSASGEEAAKDKVEQAIEALDRVDLATAALASRLGIPSAPPTELLALALALSGGPVPASTWGPSGVADIARARAWVVAEKSAQTMRTALAERWHDRLYTLELGPLHRTFVRWTGAFFLFALFFLLFPRQSLSSAAKGRLPDNRVITDDLASAVALKAAAAAHEAERSWAAVAFAGCWGGHQPEELAHALDRAETLRTTLQSWWAAGRTVPMAALGFVDAQTAEAPRAALRALADQASTALANSDRTMHAVCLALVCPRPATAAEALGDLAVYRSAFPKFRAWCFYNRAAREVEERGLGPVVAALRDGRVVPEQLADAAQRAVWSRWVTAIRDAEPTLREFDGAERRRRVARFRDADRSHLLLGRQRVLSRLDARRPAGVGGAESSEPAILARESRKQRGHFPVRQLLQSIPNLLPRLKPCLLMSPLSIAQYLPAGGRRFDLVVFDEASQICTHDAIGAIARGNQVVIVGDSRQLPPTSFFQRDAGNEEASADENDIEEMESILDEALAARIPQQMLGWHYRSRHEALIDFSNRHYYDGRLNVFPAARGKVAGLGVRWHAVPQGVYDKGNTRTNVVEAKELTEWLVGELRKTAPGTRTFGVVTFSVAQQGLIEDLLDRARGAFPEIEPHFSDGSFEPVFVKNLENVQGDERDVILFSICYGPDAAGKVWMHFGPLNRSGGERRLNVAITRARRALHVFSTLTADQVDLSRTAAVGARHLKAFLSYAAEQGSSLGRVARHAPFDSEFERQVHDVIVANGYEVDGQVGCGGYRVDLAVVHPNKPGEYLLGVECDGAPYHSAATARDRDRLRQQVLAGLGWRLHRVWSTDWWLDRDQEIARLKQAIAEALAAPDVDEAVPSPPPATAVLAPSGLLMAAPAVSPASGGTPVLQTVAPPATQPPVEPYVLAVLDPVSIDPESMYSPAATVLIAARVSETIRCEAPLHVDELCRRVASCWGISRLTDRVRQRIGKEIKHAAAQKSLLVQEDFVWAAGADPLGHSTFRGPNPGDAACDVDLIALEELAVAVKWVLTHSFSLDEASLARESARLFGLTRMGRKVDQRFSAAIALVIQRGFAARDGDRIVARS